MTSWVKSEAVIFKLSAITARLATISSYIFTRMGEINDMVPSTQLAAPAQDDEGREDFVVASPVEASRSS
jgi:hypothetical protein